MAFAKNYSTHYYINFDHLSLAHFAKNLLFNNRVEYVMFYDDKKKPLISEESANKRVGHAAKSNLVYYTAEIEHNGKLFGHLRIGFDFESHLYDLIGNALFYSMINIFSVPFVVILIVLAIRKKAFSPISLLLQAITRMRSGRYDVDFKSGGDNEWTELFLRIQQLGFSLEKTTVSKGYMELIINSMPSMLIIIDNAGKVIAANQATKKRLGYSSSEIGLRPVTEFIDFPEYSLENIRMRSSMEFAVKTKQGEKIPGMATITPLSADGRPDEEQTLLIITDMSDAIAHQREKEEMQKQLFQNSKLASIGELAQGIGHEINNPMTIINGYFKVIGKMLLSRIEITTEQYELISGKFLPAIDISIKRINDIVNGLRYYSQGDTESISKIDLNNVLKNIFLLLGEIYKQSQIDFKLDLAPEAVCCMGNAQKMQQIFTNILANAKDAVAKSPHGQITVRSEIVDNKVIISIEDNGVGIAPDNLDKIFDAFYTTKETGKGTGLGLAIVHSFVQQMQGEIKVTSFLSKGTIFSISFRRQV